MSKDIIVGVTDCSKYDAYASWIRRAGIETLKLSYRDASMNEISQCAGIVLTGGEDVHPRFYNKPEYLPYCYQEDMDEKRDELEFRVLDYSQKNKIPVLGICRGLQVANVYFGGTLIPDIPAFGKFNHSKIGGKDTYHAVKLDPNSHLARIAMAASGEINSAHHQSAELVAPDLVCTAISDDGVIEAIEWKKPEQRPYLQLVQWHPERINNQGNVFAKNLRNSFHASLGLG